MSRTELNPLGGELANPIRIKRVSAAVASAAWSPFLITNVNMDAPGNRCPSAFFRDGGVLISTNKQDSSYTYWLHRLFNTKGYIFETGMTATSRGATGQTAQYENGYYAFHTLDNAGSNPRVYMVAEDHYMLWPATSASFYNGHFYTFHTDGVSSYLTKYRQSDRTRVDARVFANVVINRASRMHISAAGEIFLVFAIDGGAQPNGKIYKTDENFSSFVSAQIPGWHYYPQYGSTKIVSNDTMVAVCHSGSNSSYSYYAGNVAVMKKDISAGKDNAYYLDAATSTYAQGVDVAAGVDCFYALVATSTTASSVVKYTDSSYKVLANSTWGGSSPMLHYGIDYYNGRMKIGMYTWYAEFEGENLKTIPQGNGMAYAFTATPNNAPVAYSMTAMTTSVPSAASSTYSISAPTVYTPKRAL